MKYYKHLNIFLILKKVLKVKTMGQSNCCDKAPNVALIQYPNNPLKGVKNWVPDSKESDFAVK